MGIAEQDTAPAVLAVQRDPREGGEVMKTASTHHTAAVEEQDVPAVVHLAFGDEREHGLCGERVIGVEATWDLDPSRYCEQCVKLAIEWLDAREDSSG